MPASPEDPGQRPASRSLVAALLGGSRVPLDGELESGPFLGLDWFLLNLIAYSAVFIPLPSGCLRDCLNRRVQTQLADRSRVFLLSALLVQVTTLLTMRPA